MEKPFILRYIVHYNGRSQIHCQQYYASKKAAFEAFKDIEEAHAPLRVEFVSLHDSRTIK